MCDALISANLIYLVLLGAATHKNQIQLLSVVLWLLLVSNSYTWWHSIDIQSDVCYYISPVNQWKNRPISILIIKKKNIFAFAMLI